MCDRKEIIRDLQEVAATVAMYAPTKNQMRLQTTIDKAIYLLKLYGKHEPMKPHRSDAWPKGIYTCGDCGMYITVIDGYRAKYCPNCGRAVKWDA